MSLPIIPIEYLQPPINGIVVSNLYSVAAAAGQFAPTAVTFGFGATKNQKVRIKRYFLWGSINLLAGGQRNIARISFQGAVQNYGDPSGLGFRIMSDGSPIDVDIVVLLDVNNNYSVVVTPFADFALAAGDVANVVLACEYVLG